MVPPRFYYFFISSLYPGFFFGEWKNIYFFLVETEAVVKSTCGKEKFIIHWK